MAKTLAGFFSLGRMAAAIITDIASCRTVLSTVPPFIAWIMRRGRKFLWPRISMTDPAVL